MIMDICRIALKYTWMNRIYTQYHNIVNVEKEAIISTFVCYKHCSMLMHVLQSLNLNHHIGFVSIENQIKLNYNFTLKFLNFEARKKNCYLNLSSEPQSLLLMLFSFLFLKKIFSLLYSKAGTVELEHSGFGHFVS